MGGRLRRPGAARYGIRGTARSVPIAVDAAGVVGLVEPAVEELEPVLDLAVPGRGAVGEERPVPELLAAILARERRVPAEVLPAPGLVHRQDDEDAVLAGLEARVAGHAEGGEHEALERL